MPPGNSAASTYPTQLMVSLPGSARDGTQFARKQYNDSEWCRWYQHLPRKMRGYREQLRSVDGLVRAIDIFTNDGFSYVHLGTGEGIQRYAIDNGNGLNTGIVDRTPGGYVPDDSFNWQFAQLYNIPGASTSIFAVGTPSASSITTSAAFPVYYGDIVDVAPLTAIAAVTCSGGCVAVAPYLMLYGHDGEVQWSTPADPTDFAGVGSGDARPTASKIVRGMPLRGQSGPAVILWSLDSVIIGTFVGGATVFDFTTVTSTGSVLSSNGFVEHNGIYYWATSSGFTMFNGVAREIPNTYNKQWFLDNLNFAERQKVFAFKIPRWNEIWWCFPKGSSTECNHAVIYNIAENCWYDTPLPNGGRSAGAYEFIFAFPIMAGVVPNEDTSGKYSMWQHEYGFNEVGGVPSTAKAVKSFYETSEFSLVGPNQPGQLGEDRAISYSSLEPDFDQVGDLMFSVISRANTRATPQTTGPLVISEVAATPEDQLVDFKHTGRLTRFRIESNTLNGNYVTGAPLIHFQPGDRRRKD